jgi:alpha-glucoside transport system permease protein
LFAGIATAIIVIVVLPLAILGYLKISETAIKASRTSRKGASRLRALCWLLPGVVVAAVVLFFPLIQTILISFQSRNGGIFANYAWIFTSPDQLRSLLNSVIWIAIVPIAVLIVGLVISVLSDRVKYEKIVRLCIIAPTAISMTAATIIWAAVYRFNPPGTTQTGLANAIYTAITGNDPIAWTLQPSLNNAALMLIGLWAWLGYAALLLTSAIKAIPEELTEAAKIDGVSEWQLFRHITLPQILPTMGVVLTIIVVWAIKVFDIVYVLTQGNYGTSVLAMDIYRELFVTQDLGKASALAVVLLLVALPIIWINLRTARRDVAA